MTTAPDATAAPSAVARSDAQSELVSSSPTARRPIGDFSYDVSAVNKRHVKSEWLNLQTA